MHRPSCLGTASASERHTSRVVPPAAFRRMPRPRGLRRSHPSGWKQMEQRCRAKSRARTLAGLEHPPSAVLAGGARPRLPREERGTREHVCDPITRIWTRQLLCLTVARGRGNGVLTVTRERAINLSGLFPHACARSAVDGAGAIKAYRGSQ